MAGSVNKVILIGNLGADPDVRNTKDGRRLSQKSNCNLELQQWQKAMKKQALLPCRC